MKKNHPSKYEKETRLGLGLEACEGTDDSLSKPSLPTPSKIMWDVQYLFYRVSVLNHQGYYLRDDK